MKNEQKLADPKHDATLLKGHYGSPRWTQEIADCSMPMTFDTYSNCSFNCAYCLSPDTPILMWDLSEKRLADVEVGDEVVGVELPAKGWPRVKKSVVLNKWSVRKPAFRLSVADGRSVVCSADHRWHTDRGWKKTHLPARTRGDTRLTERNKITSFTPDVLRRDPDHETSDYKAGYLNGVIRGDANMKKYAQRGKGTLYRFRLAMKLGSAVARAKRYLADFGVEVTEFDFPMVDRATKRTIHTRAIRCQNRAGYEAIGRVIRWRDSVAFRKGFLAGAYEAEGYADIRACRFYNKNQRFLDDFTDCLTRFGFAWKYHKENHGCRTVYFGGSDDRIRFAHLTGLDGFFCRIEGMAVRRASIDGARVASVEDLGEERDLIDITTTTENFIANGLLSHNCFSQFQRQNGGAGETYRAKQVRAVDVERIKELFRDPSPGNPRIARDLRQFIPYVSQRRVMQWGGLSDQFDGFERKYGKTLELLRFFKEIDYPLCFSTKSVWWTKDERYMELFRGQRNWNVKFSIITLDERKARVMEEGVPSPYERLLAIERIANAGAGGATLRLRPFIIGLSTPTYLDLIQQAADRGATALSTEFFCADVRSKSLRAKMPMFNALCGFDVFAFYKKHSSNKGYMRLNRNVKQPFIDRMEQKCREVGMRFYVSDAHFKERCCNGSCCGLPESANYSRGQFCEALHICKERGVVYWKDIAADVESLLGGFQWRTACGYNTNSSELKAKFYNETMAQYLRWLWNSPMKGQSPYTMFGGIMKPVGRDDAGDLIYVWNGRRSEVVEGGEAAQSAPPETECK